MRDGDEAMMEYPLSSVPPLSKSTGQASFPTSRSYSSYVEQPGSVRTVAKGVGEGAPRKASLERRDIGPGILT
jgi:hypothetical protein